MLKRKRTGSRKSSRKNSGTSREDLRTAGGKSNKNHNGTSRVEILTTIEKSNKENGNRRNMIEMISLKI